LISSESKGTTIIPIAQLILGLPIVNSKQTLDVHHC